MPFDSQAPFEDSVVYEEWNAALESAGDHALVPAIAAFDELHTIVAERWNGLSSAATEAAGQLESGCDTLDQANISLPAKFASAVTAVQELLELCDDKQTELDAACDAFELALKDGTRNVHEIQTAIVGVLDTYDAMVDEVETSLDSRDDNFSQLLSTAKERLESETNAVAETLRDAAQNLAGFGEYLDDDVVATSARLESIAEAAVAGGREFMETSADQCAESKAAGTTRIAGGSMNSLSQWGQAIGKTSDDLCGGIDGAMKELDQGLGRVLQPVQPVLSALEQMKPVLEVARTLL